MQFRVAVDAFLQSCSVERRLSSHTTQAYACDLADFRKWLGTGATPEQVSTATLKAYLEDMVSERALTTATIRRRFACLRSFYKFLVDVEQTKNPFEGWHLKLARRKRLPRTLSRPEATRLLSTFSSPFIGIQAGDPDMNFAIIVRLMISTGLRVGEVCKLHTDDILSAGSMIRIRGKGAKERIVYVTNAEFAEEIEQLRVKRNRHGAAPLFINRHGSIMRPQSVRLRLRKLAQDEGLARRITPHMLRHTAATLLIETGVDIRFVQRLLGHSSIATTEIYTHVSDEALRTTLARANVLGMVMAR